MPVPTDSKVSTREVPIDRAARHLAYGCGSNLDEGGARKQRRGCSDSWGTANGLHVEIVRDQFRRARGQETEEGLQ